MNTSCMAAGFYCGLVCRLPVTHTLQGRWFVEALCWFWGEMRNFEVILMKVMLPKKKPKPSMVECLGFE